MTEMSEKPTETTKKRGRKPIGERAMTGAERAALFAARRADIGERFTEALKGVNWKLRAKAERDPVFFAKTYCTGEGGFLEVAPPPALQAILREMSEAVLSSAIPYHIRMPRGTGKTAFEKCILKWAITFGHRRYIVATAANGANAANILEDVFLGMTENQAYVRDFPEVAVPFLELGGSWQRSPTQTILGEHTHPQKSATKIVLPHVINPKTGLPFASSGAILEAVGFSAGARGKGKMSQRPDLVVLDDLQTDTDAESDTQVAKIVRKVKRTFLGLAGHRKKIAAIMTSTPIEPDDVSETFAKDRGWKTSTYQLLGSWPKCHDPTAKDAPGLFDHWDEYAAIYATEKDAGREPHVAANAYYRKHRREMDMGAKVLNPLNFDPDTEISGIQHAMNLLYRDGLDSFMSEYQMDPPRNSFAFEISSRLILSRIRKGLPSKTLPEGTVYVAAATDVNPSYGLTSAITAFDAQLTGTVIAYHVTKCAISDKLNEAEFNRRVYEAACQTGREISALGIKLDAWGIDAGGKQFAAITRFAAMSETACGLKATAMLGRAGVNWNPMVRSRVASALNDTVKCRDPQGRRWLAWNADSYKEKVHRAFGTETGAPGGLSIFDGNANHSAFAAQVANEKLLEKTKVSTRGDEERWSYKWRSRNPHDYGDALAMCYALAGAVNLTGDGSYASEEEDDGPVFL